MARLTKTRNPGLGRDFYFFGKFRSKILASRSEREHPGSFIISRKGYYYVLKDKSRRNPASKIPKSYYVRLLAGKGFLLGGVKSFVSSRFEKYTDARDLMETSRETNIQAGRDVLSAQVIGSDKKPEIFHSEVIGRNPEWKPPFAKRKRKRLGELYRKAFTQFSKENPRRRGVLIYGKVLKIFAQKTEGPYKGQQFVHTFKPGAIMVGMPDGSIRISHP